jgi:CNT family concentrative nucleoside transporter
MLRLLVIALTIVLTSIGCTKKSEEISIDFQQKIKRKWSFSAAIPTQGNPIDLSNQPYYLSFYSEQSKNRFAEFTGENEILGSWYIEDSTLVNEVVPKGVEIAVDSVVNKIDFAGNHFLEFLTDKKIIAKLENGELKPIPAKQKFKILMLNDAQLILEHESGTILELTYTPSVMSSGISFNSIFRGLIGVISLLLLAYLFSSNRKAINWNLVLKGLALQLIIALLILKVPGVDLIFDEISKLFAKIINFTNEGVKFLFAQIGMTEVQPPMITFAITILPTIIFFSALTSLFYYWGILQKIVYAFAWVMKRFMKLSGAESLAAAGNIFLGQTEAPLLVKPYLLGMTKSEIMCLMTGGMATIAGGVLAAYISFLGGDDPAQQIYFAKHLLTASVISAPAAIVAAKMLVPEQEEINQDLQISKEKIGSNALEAITNGTGDGLRLAVNVGAMLLVFISLMAMANYILGDMIGDWLGINEAIAKYTPYDKLSFQMIVGYLCAPIVYLMGVASEDIILVGELLGQKTILNEFVAYPRLGELIAEGKLQEKSILMSTYMLCGFANFASIGIQIGGIGSLIPNRKGLLSQLGFKALIGGTIACLFTAVVVGMLY